jgi:hypothetical protein
MAMITQNNIAKVFFIDLFFMLILLVDLIFPLQIVQSSKIKSLRPNHQFPLF